MGSNGTTRLGGRVGRACLGTSRDRLYRHELLDLSLFEHQVGERDAREEIVHSLLQRLPDGTNAARASSVAARGVDRMRVEDLPIRDDHTFVDLPQGMPKEIFRHLQKVRVAGQQLQIGRARKSMSTAPARDERPRPDKHKPHKGPPKKRERR